MNRTLTPEERLNERQKDGFPSSEGSPSADTRNPSNFSSSLRKTGLLLRRPADLLILRSKREETGTSKNPNEDLSPPFSVCNLSSSPDREDYEKTLEECLAFIDTCMYLEDAEGKPLPKWTVAQRLRAIGIPLPIAYQGYGYLPSVDYLPPYWEDAGDYAHLMEPRHRVLDTE